MKLADYGLCVLLGLASSTGGAMDMQVIDGQLILSGAVEGNEYRRIMDRLEQYPAIDTVILRNSPGGDANTGYRVGELFRERGLRTAVSGYCNSSCSRMFLGGKERHFTDDYPVGKTWIGFHSNYTDEGQIVHGAPARLKTWIMKYSDGKADEALVERWVAIPYRKGYAYFFDGKRLKRSDGISVFLCSGHEPSGDRFNQCEKIAGKTAFDLGVVTSADIISSRDAKTLK